MVCRLILQERYAVGQPITATIEIKNTSKKTRSIIRFLELESIDYLSLTTGLWRKYNFLVSMSSLYEAGKCAG
jgi:hypothetical protein